MHDGRFNKLNEVLNHYTDGLENRSNPSRQLKSGIELTSKEKIDLIAFILTLNDKAFVFNKAHHFPRDLLLPINQ